MGILRPSRIGKSKIYRPSRCRVIDDRKNRPWQFCVGCRSLLTACRQTQGEQSRCCCRLQLVVESQYCQCQATECLRSLHSRQSRVQGTTSKRALETGSLHIWHTPNVPCLIRASASSIARKRGGPGPGADDRAASLALRAPDLPGARSRFCLASTQAHAKHELSYRQSNAIFCRRSGLSR